MEGQDRHLCALQRHAAGGLREPLVPADGHPDGRKPGLEGLEPRVARVEVELLLVPGPTSKILLIDCFYAVGTQPSSSMTAGSMQELADTHPVPSGM